MIIKTFNLIRWSLRKLALPIKAQDLVLEIGSGGNPHPASDVLLEKFVDSSHRLRPIKIDRTMVLADACKMPFKNKSFDYSIAFHVLEHVPEPSLFLNELMRVSKGGYIETPNFLYERLRPLDVHLLEVATKDATLLIRKKSAAVDDKFFYNLDVLKNDKNWLNIFNKSPHLFHVCYSWSEIIKFAVINSEQSTAWHTFPKAGLIDDNIALQTSRKIKIDVRACIISLVRFVYKIKKCNKRALLEILACPECHSALIRITAHYKCTCCGASYKAEPVADFTSSVT